MKCLFAVAFLALVAVVLAEEPVAAVPTQNEKAVEPVNTEVAKDARDKRGLLVTTYATAPVAYAAYAAPVAYHATYAVPYAYSSVVHSYPVSYSPSSIVVA